MRNVSKMMVIIVSVCVIAVSSIYYNYKFVRYDSDKIVFGATYMTMNNSFYKAITDEIEKQINDRGDILYTRDPALDVEKQNEQINDLIEMGIDVLIINPVDYSKVNASLKKAKEKGIKIIVIDAQLDDDTIAKAQAAFSRTDSVGQQRMAALHNGKRDKLEISPNLWAGVGLVRGGAGTALVGDGPTVAARINEYAALGIDSFVLSGYPHLEEAYKVGELLFPHLDVAIPEIPQPQPLNPQGEAVANDFIPRNVAQS